MKAPPPRTPGPEDRPFLDRPLARYAVAALAVGLSYACRELLVPVIGHNTLYITLFPAVMVVAVLQGAGPALASALLGVGLFELNVIGTDHAATSPASLAVRLGILLGAAGFVGWTSARMRSARREAALEARAAHRAEEALRRAVADLEVANAALHDSKRAALSLMEDAVAARQKAEDGQRVLDALMASVPEGITLADAPDGRVLMVSRHGQELLGLPHVGLCASEIATRLPLFQADGVTPLADDEIPLLRAVRRGETVHEVELVQVAADGRRLTLSCNAAPIRDPDGRITGGIVAWRDVAAQREAERRHSRILATALDGYLMADKTGRLLEVNDALCSLLGYSRQELLALTLADIEALHSPDVIREHLDELSRTGFAHFESKHRCQDGSVIDVAVNATWLGGSEESVVAFVSDITARKRAEERVRASLLEHEVLLKEIHHRVKNNLQIIASLVALQRRDLPFDVRRDLFDDVHDRVRSMALVHEKLYQSANLSCIDFADYATSLLTHLWHAHGASLAGVRLVQRFERVLLSIDEAVPCGLILNELVSNALKHAFRDRPAGQVVVTLAAGSDGRFHLGVSDDGWGLPAEVDWKHSRTLGLRLVQMLAAQLNASVTLTNDAGCAFFITFNLPAASAGASLLAGQGVPT